ncbi:MAG: MinD/ParA family protein [Chloroflexota bacterium]|nr:MinD/ParA family protein [Chloroflexota bacterium]
MATIVSVHSFRGGTGKSNTTANVAAVLASQGKRVGVIDGDIQSPGIHTLFGLAGADVTATLNDFLWHGRAIGDVALDVTERQDASLPGRMYLIPSSMQPTEITRVLREGYDARYLTEGIRALVGELSLDVLVLDTHPGLNEETLLSLVISDALLIIMRPDRQDYEGTGITARVAKELAVPSISIVVNKAPEVLDHAAIARQVERAYDCPVVAVLPHSNELMLLASEGLFVLRNPDHPVSHLYRLVANAIASPA